MEHLSINQNRTKEDIKSSISSVETISDELFENLSTRLRIMSSEERDQLRDALDGLQRRLLAPEASKFTIMEKTLVGATALSVTVDLVAWALGGAFLMSALASLATTKLLLSDRNDKRDLSVNRIEELKRIIESID
jgi:hypothetical protein